MSKYNHFASYQAQILHVLHRPSRLTATSIAHDFTNNAASEHNGVAMTAKRQLCHRLSYRSVPAAPLAAGRYGPGSAERAIFTLRWRYPQALYQPECALLGRNRRTKSVTAIIRVAWILYIANESATLRPSPRRNSTCMGTEANHQPLVFVSQASIFHL